MILVVGATGNVGREAVGLLVSKGLPVRALSRRQQRAELPRGVETVRGDLSRAETLELAFAGVHKIILVVATGANVDDRQLGAILEMASESGARQVVLVSSVAAGAAPDNVIGRHHLALERAVQKSGLAWTVMRAGMFMSNCLDWAETVREEGKVQAAFGDLTTAPIDPFDVAAVGVEALLSDGHDATTYVLSGPEEISTRDQVHTLARVLGRDIAFEELAENVARRELERHASADVVDAMVDMLKSPTKELSRVLPTVGEVMGSPGRTFQEWARLHVDEFR